MTSYEFQTDSESGTIEAADFSAAIEELRQIVPAAAVADGGWGWIEDEAGERHEIR